jgi:hypothetical protein
LSGLSFGSDKGEAAMMASAWAISALVGWGFYNLFWTPNQRSSFGILYAIQMGGIGVAKRTATPWPFTSRVAFGIITTIILVLVSQLLVGILYDREDLGDMAKKA